MEALAFWKAVAMDQSNFLEGLTSGQPGSRLGCRDRSDGRTEKLLGARFHLERFPHSLNVSEPDSRLRVQIQTDPRYFDFPSRSTEQEVLGLRLPVAAIEDVLNGKIWAAQDPDRRASKRRKDLLDIERLIEAHPMLRSRVPADIIERLVI